MLLFFDSETSDLYKRHLPPTDPAQPWIVSLAAELCDMDGTPRDFFATRIRAEGRKIREGAQAVHGMSSRDADKAGVSEIVALGLLSGFAAQSLRAIGHGISFDKDVAEGVLLRKGKDPKLLTRAGLEYVDTMLAATSFCKLPPDPPRDDGGFKWPSLDEACQILLGEAPRPGTHNAWTDLQRAKRVYFWLLERGAFEAVS